MEWFKTSVNDILLSDKEDWQILAIMKYKALFAQLEHEPTEVQALRILKKKEWNFIKIHTDFIKNSVESQLKSKKNQREHDKKYFNKNKELNKNSSIGTDIDTNGKNRIDKNKKDITNVISKKETPNLRFCKPTVEEVRLFCLERKNTVSPQKFVDFYESKGWLVGKSPMKDWRAAVRNWERQEAPANQKAVENNDFDGIGDWL